jgi:DNA-damage-inducible protein J
MREKVKQTRYNKETLAAVEEARSILNGERQTKSYSCAKELFDEIETEFRAEQRRETVTG